MNTYTFTITISIHWSCVDGNCTKDNILTALSQPAGQIIHVSVQVRKNTELQQDPCSHSEHTSGKRRHPPFSHHRELHTGIQARGRMLKTHISTTSSLTSFHSMQLSTLFAYQQIIKKGNKQKFVSLREEINGVPIFHYVAKGKIKYTSRGEYQSCSSVHGIFYCRIVKSLLSQHNYTNTPVF